MKNNYKTLCQMSILTLLSFIPIYQKVKDTITPIRWGWRIKLHPTPLVNTVHLKLGEGLKDISSQILGKTHNSILYYIHSVFPILLQKSEQTEDWILSTYYAYFFWKGKRFMVFKTYILCEQKNTLHHYPYSKHTPLPSTRKKKPEKKWRIHTIVRLKT